jgi:hypothetical protein
MRLRKRIPKYLVYAVRNYPRSHWDFDCFADQQLEWTNKKEELVKIICGNYKI